MPWKLKFISYTLLLAYALAFGHQVIPHCHHDVNATERSGHIAESHEHHHHRHTNTAHEGHEHIAHADHFDEDLLDFLNCILNETQHADSNEEGNTLLPRNTAHFHLKTLVCYPVSADLMLAKTPLLDLLEEESYPSDQPSLYKAPLPPSLAFRGPPSLLV